MQKMKVGVDGRRQLCYVTVRNRGTKHTAPKKSTGTDCIHRDGYSSPPEEGAESSKRPAFVDLGIYWVLVGLARSVAQVTCATLRIDSNSDSDRFTFLAACSFYASRNRIWFVYL